MRNPDRNSHESNDSYVRPSRNSPGIGASVIRSIIVLVCIGAAGLVLAVLALNRPTPSGERDVFIRKGMSVLQIGRALRREGVIRSPRLLVLFSRFSGTSRQLKAGFHRFHGDMSTWEVHRELSVSRERFRTVTVPEGRTLNQTLRRLAVALDLDEEKLLRLVNDPGFCRRLGVTADNLEGYLFPETYRFSLMMDEEQVVRMMVRQFHDVFDEGMADRTRQLEMTVHEVVTLASIIEGEARLDGERATISAVYHNRLRRGMYLQADPTVQYAIEGGRRRLFYRDYEVDSPYNTYRHRGLPPGPVMCPGAASLRAALYPANVDFLFFVARGDGSHVFSSTAGEHDAAKRKTKWARRRSWQSSGTP
ncbi:MAG: endolytic transglycosylase MltG [Gemmatimonadota bacterium]|nr:endolytic transglycosylase MltG [Gemmatimonadota bacterium]